MGIGIRSAAGGDDDDTRLSELALRFPEAPAEELVRFLGRRGGVSVEDATAAYGAHLEWRQGPGAPERLLQAACAVPPGFVRAAGAARDGSTVILVQGARYDPSVASEEYVLACAQALYTAVPSGSEGTVTILIDTHQGQGWPNAPATKMIPFFRSLCTSLPDHFPERMDKVIMFPVTSIVSYFWSLISVLLDKSIKGSCVTLSGRTPIGSPCPKELGEYVTLDALPDDARDMYASLAAGVVAGDVLRAAAR